jgi:hypothetical protein
LGVTETRENSYIDWLSEQDSNPNWIKSEDVPKADFLFIAVGVGCRLK